MKSFSSNLKLTSYLTLKKSAYALINIGFWTLVSIALLSIVYMFINPIESFILRGIFDALFWVDALWMPVVVSSIAYGTTSSLLALYSTKIKIVKNGFKIVNGLFNKRVTFIPRHLLDQVELRQSLLQKAFGIITLNVERKSKDPQIKRYLKTSETPVISNLPRKRVLVS